MSYIAGLALTFEIPLVDGAGNSVDATAVSYSVLDGDGTVLVASTPLAGYVAGSDAVITVPSGANTLDAGEVKAAREISLICTTATGQALVTKTYIIEASTGALVRGVNSLVTLGSADMIADETQCSSFLAANTGQKTNALLEAYRRLSLLRFNFRKWDIDDDSRAWYPNGGNGSLEDMSASALLGIEPKVLKAISYAQVAEADSILSGDDAESRRRTGLVLETIGEVKQMFRNGKPLELAVSRKALNFISAYVVMGSKRIGRA